MLTRKTDDFTPPPMPAKFFGNGNANGNGHAITAASDEHSLINTHLIMRGDLESDADILVKGKVYGNIRCKLLIVDTSAYVEGAIEADEVVVRGTTKGKISADRVRLERTATVESDIEHANFAAEEGARIRGSLNYRDAHAARGPKTTQ